MSGFLYSMLLVLAVDAGKPASVDRIVQSSTSLADLSLIVQGGGGPDPSCHELNEELTIRVELGATNGDVAGGQFLVLYDPDCLQFVSAAPGQACDPDSPIVHELFLTTNASARSLFYAASVVPTGQGAPGPMTMACLTFVKIEACSSCDVCFGNQNPQNTRISDSMGNPIPYQPHCSAVIRESAPPSSSCPQDLSAQVTCGDSTAEVTWDAPQVLDPCADPIPLSCSGTHDGGADVAGLAQTGGMLPIGVSTFCCDGTSDCGVPVECCWTVTVDAAADTDCFDGDDCTQDACDPSSVRAGPDGCVHDRLVILHGDVFPLGGDALLDVDDLLCVVFGFSDPETCPGGDLAPCGGDGDINVDDLLAMLSVFSGEPHCADPCPL